LEKWRVQRSTAAKLWQVNYTNVAQLARKLMSYDERTIGSAIFRDDYFEGSA
jgi:hypothetical protein